METASLSSSPKLTKKPSLGDIRSLSGAEKKTYGCGRSLNVLQQICVLTFVDHIKDLFDNAQQEALKQYTRIVQTINKTLDISTRVPRGSAALTLKPTYLCLQCPSVATAEQRDRHDKGHRLCKRDFIVILP